MAVFIAVMFIGQIAERTDLLFAVLTATYIALWTAAFNVAGGLNYASGAYIFSSGLLSVVLGFGAKVVLGEPGQRNLRSPTTTMEVLTLSMAMMLLVAFTVRKLRPEKGLLKGFTTLSDLNKGSYICFFLGWGLTVASSLGPVAEGTVLSALRQVNGFPYLSIMFGTVYEIRRSGGERSMSWLVKIGIAASFLSGMLFFSKEGMVIGFLAWGFAAFSEGYNFRRYQVFAAVFGLTFFSYYLAPYSQYVRDYASENHSVVENIPIAIEYLSDLPRTRRLYLETQERYDVTDGFHLYDEPVGFLDRLVQVAADDTLIDYTAQGHVFGLLPTYLAYANVVPHFIWHDKNIIGAGNVYAREMNILPDSDTTTGISFDAPADAFHQASWLGVLLLFPFDVFILFIAYDTVFGNVKYNCFTLLPILFALEVGAAEGLEGPVRLATLGLISLLFLFLLVQVVGTRLLTILMPRGSFDPESNISIGESLASETAAAANQG